MRKIIILAFFTIISFSTHAQDISSVFLTMPESIVFGLEAAQKEALLENTDNVNPLTVNRPIYGEIKRLALSSDFMSLQTSDAGTIQIKLLPLINDSKIICVVRTVCGRVCDSQIVFYTTTWLPIAQSDLFPKKNKDWFIRNDVDRENQDFKNAYAALDMNPIRIILSSSNDSAIAEYDIKGYLSEDDYKRIEPYLTGESKTLEWDKVSYK